MACMNKDNRDALKLVFGDLTLGVQGKDEDGEAFSYIFSYACGGPESLVRKGTEWLYRAPKPTFWRALTDNDRGCGFHFSSGIWLAADMYIRCVGIEVSVDGEKAGLPMAPLNNRYSGEERAKNVEIRFLYETITQPFAKTEVSYLVSADGRIHVQAHYFGQEGLPELPVFGMRIIMPFTAEGFVYEGLSGETYPDRMSGGIPGTYEVSGLPVTPYLVPQECGMHMETRRVTIKCGKGKKACTGDVRELSVVQGNEPFAFSCLPYTAQELENATHQEELPPARRTVLCILGAVRGVGGINSWGAEPEAAYHISAKKDIAFDFVIC